MSAKKRDSAGFKYLKIKDGNLYYTTDKNHENPYDEVEGNIVNLVFKTETWEKQEIEKLQVYLHDGEGYDVLTFPVDSSWFSTFVSFAKNADLSKPVTLHVMEKAEKDKSGKDVKRRTLLVSQDGTYMKSYYNREHPNGLPTFKQVKISGRLVWEKSEFLDFLKNVVENELKPQLPAFSSGKVIKKEEPEEEVEELSDLPF
jgi:uncharacterized protein (UPF0333 family)